MKRINRYNQPRSFILSIQLKSETIRIGFVLSFLIVLFQLKGQNPNWEVNYEDFQNQMRAIITVSDECVPSADNNDIVAAFDMTGQIRGVEKMNTNNKAFLTIGSNGSGEEISFKVYDAGTANVYNIHNSSVNFSEENPAGTISEPFILNFDSNPTSISGGTDQWVVDATSTNLNATGDGTWSLIPGEVGVIADPSDPKTLFTGEIGKTYLLAWTSSDTEGCIGETDEVSITFAVSQSEDTPERCADGVDNDGNGLTDCQELACGKPTISSISKIDPTPLSCSAEMSDGSIVINHKGASSFSIDNGATSQVSSSFSNLETGDYNVLIKNDFAGCTAIESISLINTLNTAPPVPTFEIDGPSVICSGNDGVSYSLDKPLNGNVVWSYSGNDVIINATGVNGALDFGDNASMGMLTAVMSNACSSNSASMEIGIANSFLCSSFSNCLPIVNVNSSLLENANISHVFQAGDQLNSDAQLSNHNYEFSAGNALEFDVGFSVDNGLSFIADIKTCSN